MGGRIPGAVPVQVGATGTPAAAVVLGEDDLEDFRAVGSGHPLLAASDRPLPAHIGLHRQRRDAQLQGFAVQCAADAPGESGPVQEDARVLVFAGAVLRLAVVFVELQIAFAAQALVAELPVVLGQLLYRVVQPGAVVVVGQERAVRATPVVRAARDGALTGGGAEYTVPGG